MAADASSSWPADALEVGRIGEASGLQGAFRVVAYADPPLALLSARHWHLRPPEEPRPGAVAAAIPTTLEIKSVRARGDGYVASSPAIADRAAAESLRGARIFVARSAFPAPEEDEFYWADLIGMTVADRAGGMLGVVVGLIDNGAQSVLRVQPPAPEAAELLIPFVSAYVDRVDLAGRQIAVDWQADY